MKLYKIKYYMPEIYDFCEIALSEEEYKQYREAVDEARRDYETDFPEEKDNEEGWNQYLEESISAYNFTFEYCSDVSWGEAKVLWIDLDHPREVEEPNIPDEATMKCSCKALAEYNHLLQKICREQLTNKELDLIIACLADSNSPEPETNIDFATVVRFVPADIIADFWDAFDPTKAYFSMPEEREMRNKRLDISEVAATLCVRFAREEEMPEVTEVEYIPLESLGYYDAEAFQIVFCPERIKKAQEQSVQKDNPENSSPLYKKAFVAAMISAAFDHTNHLDKHGHIVREPSTKNSIMILKN